MSRAFFGPWAIEAGSVTASARTALSEAGAALRAGDLSALPHNPRADQPGLYLILQEGSDRPVLEGFWIVFGPSFLDDGPVGPPERVPPYAGGLLDAATEEVWWKNLPVSDGGSGLWRPIIVAEWPSSIAVRSSAAPPGVPARSDAPRRGAASEEDGWLDARLGAAAALKVEPEEEPAGDDPYAKLPERRGLITVIQGQLRYTKALHTGGWRLVPSSAFPSGPALVPLEDWLDAALAPEWPDPPAGALGPPLMAPGGRVAFPLQGWLTRGLERWPDPPTSITPGVLAAREVQTKWKGQVARALGSMIAVLVGVGGLATGVRLLAEPRPQPLAITPTPAPQPAMSVCSADHQAFVEELRCQIDALASTSDATAPACGDSGSAGRPPDLGQDLQAAYCGLLDRTLDGWTGNRVKREQTYSFGHLALSQACFNVLGRPFPYTQPAGFSGGVEAADPERFLEDPDLSIASLVEARDQLEAACDLYRGRAEARVEGAIFATHVGEPFSPGAAPAREAEPSALRRALVSQATEGLSAEASRCFQAGVTRGVPEGTWRGLCGEPDGAEEKLQTYKIWQQLAGSEVGADGDVVSRYTRARFGLASGPPSKTDSALWTCHLTLGGALPSALTGSASALWDLMLPVPQGYDLGGAGARSQLVLDAGLRAFEAGLDAGVCWDLVKRRLIAYGPAHPLLEPLDEDGWPSVEQRLCGQVCASTFRLVQGPERGVWLSPEADLRRCLRTDAPSDVPDLGRGGLDQLRLPATGRPWQEPTAAQVCAYNLVAQGYFPEGDEGFIVGGRSPVEWAGETAPGSRIAGGPEGLAADAIRGMTRYGAGTGWSVGRCGYVATQCFSELLLEISGDPRAERYEWLHRWNDSIDALASARPAALASEHPWCAPLQPYLGEVTDMAQIDTPCRRGVELARQNVERAVRTFAAGSNGGAR